MTKNANSKDWLDGYHQALKDAAALVNCYKDLKHGHISLNPHIAILETCEELSAAILAMKATGL